MMPNHHYLMAAPGKVKKATRLQFADGWLAGASLKGYGVLDEQVFVKCPKLLFRMPNMDFNHPEIGRRMKGNLG